MKVREKEPVKPVQHKNAQYHDLDRGDRYRARAFRCVLLYILFLRYGS